MQSSELYVIQRVQTEFRGAGFEHSFIYLFYRYSVWYRGDTVAIEWTNEVWGILNTKPLLIN